MQASLPSAVGYRKLADAMFRGEYGRREQKAADKKAMADAQAQIAEQIASNIVPGYGLLANMALQAAIGSKNGLEGALAGALNGAIAGAGLPVGVGLTYDKKNGWGAKVGVGGNGANASLSVSQRGGAQASVSYMGANLNYNGADGSFGGGYTYGLGETGLSLGANWNSKESFSVTASYSAPSGPMKGSGISVTQGRNGFSASSSYKGTQVGTMTAAGFNLSAVDFADQNLDAAKDKYDEEAALKKKGAMTKTGDSYTERLLNRLNPENPAHRDALEALAKITGPDGKVNLDNVPPEEAEAALKKLALADANLNPITFLQSLSGGQKVSLLGASYASRGELFPLMAGQSYKDGDSAFKFLDTMKNDFKNMFTLPSSGTLTGSAGMVDENGFFHPRTCFTAGTKIRVLKKSVASKVKRPEDIPVTKEFEELANIEDVRAGDYVLTRDEHTEKSSYRKVTELFRHEVKLLYRIVLSDGTRLDTTWNHPFYVTGSGDRDLGSERKAYGVQRKAGIFAVSLIGASKLEGDSPSSALSLEERNLAGLPFARLNALQKAAGQWTEAKDIKKGYNLMNSHGKNVTVASVEVLHVPETKVYNFEVERTHNYFVGEQGVLVHNYEIEPNVKQLLINNDQNSLRQIASKEKFGFEGFLEILKNGFTQFKFKKDIETVSLDKVKFKEIDAVNGNKSELKEKFVEQLNLLSDSTKIIIDENGNLKMLQVNTAEEKKENSRKLLEEAFLKHNKNIEISISDDKHNRSIENIVRSNGFAAVPGIGSDVHLSFNLDYRKSGRFVKYTEKDGSGEPAGKVEAVYGEKAEKYNPSHIGLAHELIHIASNVNGFSSKDMVWSVREDRKQFGITERMPIDLTEAKTVTRDKKDIAIFADKIGNKEAEYPQNSISNYLRYYLGMKYDTFVTENTIRDEHKLPLRADY